MLSIRHDDDSCSKRPWGLGAPAPLSVQNIDIEGCDNSRDGCIRDDTFKRAAEVGGRGVKNLRKQGSSNAAGHRKTEYWWCEGKKRLLRRI